MGALDCRRRGEQQAAEVDSRRAQEVSSRNPSADLLLIQGCSGTAGGEPGRPRPLALRASQQASLGRQSQSQATVPVARSPKNTRPCGNAGGWREGSAESP